jgi:cyclophilin family peptidyl-prolyl cis-trans isomerase
MLITIQTSEGTIKADLDEEKAPITVENFMRYVDDGHYDGTIFHRVIPSFMIQGGGFSADMKQKPVKAPIRNEAGNGLTNDRGTLAMARTSVVDSATSQFFINTADNAFLNHRGETPDAFGYAVFGKVVEGMDVVDRIEKLPTGRAGHHDDVPVKPVVIQSIRPSQG